MKHQALPFIARDSGYTCHEFKLLFEIFQSLLYFLLKSIVIAASLTLDKTGKPLFHEPTKRTMLRNYWCIWLFCIYFSIHAQECSSGHRL